MKPIYVKPGDYGFGSELETTKVRSCIAIAVLSNETKGLMHFSYPHTDSLDSFLNKVSTDSKIVLAGAGSYTSVGRQNYGLAKQMLAEKGLELIAEDIGGFCEYTVRVDGKGVIVAKRPYDMFASGGMGLHEIPEEVSIYR